MKNLAWFKAILYRACHRSTKEADQILGTFARTSLETLDPEELISFQTLLDQDDPDILTWVQDPEHSPSQVSRSLLKKINAYQANLLSDSGYSLVELALALGIIGVMMGGILKGQQLIENARLKSILHQINQFRIATTLYLDKHGSLPMPNQSNQIEDQQFWSLLKSEGLVTGSSSSQTSSERVTSKLGGSYFLEYDQGHYWITLKGDQGHSGILTPSQAEHLMKQVDSDNTDSASVQARGDECVDRTKLKTDIKKTVCWVRFRL